MGHMETAHDIFILTQQQPWAETCYKKSTRGSLPAQGPCSFRGKTSVIFLGRFCALLSESRVEQICEYEVVDCACLDWGNEALKLSRMSCRKEHGCAGGLHVERSPFMLPPWHKPWLYLLNAFQTFTFSGHWIIIYYVYMQGKVKNNTEKLKSWGGLLSAKSVFIKTTPIFAYRLKQSS